MKRTLSRVFSFCLALLMVLVMLPEPPAQATDGDDPAEAAALPISAEPNSTEINSVSVTLDAPAIGASPDYTAVFPYGAHYYSAAYNFSYMLNDIRWKDLTTNTVVKPDSDVFQEEHVYIVEIYLTAQDGYAFADGASAMLNGQTAEVEPFDDQLLVKFTFPVLTMPGPIPSVSVTLDAPAIGASPDYTAVFPYGAHYYSGENINGYYRNGIIWTDMTTGSWMDPVSDVFQAGHEYQVHDMLTEEKYYRFTDDITATLNGQPAEASTYEDQLRVSYTFPALPEAIPSVEITLDAPSIGARPDYTAVFPEGAHYYSATNNSGYYFLDIQWADTTSPSWLVPNTDVFQAGHGYKVFVYLTARPGYAFTENATATLNGQPAEATLSRDQLKVTYVFPALEDPHISSVEIIVDGPAVGARPDYEAWFPDDAHYYSEETSGSFTRNDIEWLDADTNTGLNPDTDVFQAGHRYQVQVYLTAEYGFEFTDSTTATLNGGRAEASLEEYGQLLVTYTFPTLVGSISSVEVTLDAPVIGAHPDYTAVFSEGVGYYTEEFSNDFYLNSIAWLDIDLDTWMKPDTDVFQVGHTYRVYVYLKAQDGYEFTDSAASTLNGQPAQTVIEYGQLLVSYTFPALAEPVSITTQPVDCVVNAIGDTATFTVVASGEGLSYQWWIKNPTDSAFRASSIKKATYSTPVTETSNGRQLYCVVTDQYGNSVMTNTVTMRVNIPLKITTQPGNQTVAEGATATFKVVASGNGLKYQWQYKTSATASWRNSSSATTGYNTATLKVVGTTERNGFQYRCKVTDGNGNSVTSNVATLTVTTGPKITTQPGNQTVAEGATATFKVVASGTGLKYQWQFKTSATASWRNSSSATTGYNTATLKVVGTAERNGFQYRCKVTDSNGNTVISNAVTLTVTTGPKITTQPKSVVVAKAGDTATTTVVATGEGLTYQWYIKNVGDSAFKASAIKKATYSTTVTEACNGRQLYCIVKDKNGKTVQSDTITFTIAAALKITRQPVNAYVKAIGDTAKITVKAEGEGLTYTWYYKNPGASTFTKSSYKTATYATPVTSTSNGRQVYCVIKDQNGNSVTTDTVTMSKATGLAIITQPEDVSVANGAAVSVAIEAYGTGLTYQWYFKDAGASSFSKSSIKTATYTTTMNADRNGRQIYCVVKDSASNTVQTITVTLTMK